MLLAYVQIGSNERDCDEEADILDMKATRHHVWLPARPPKPKKAPRDTTTVIKRLKMVAEQLQGVGGDANCLALWFKHVPDYATQYLGALAPVCPNIELLFMICNVCVLPPPPKLQRLEVLLLFAEGTTDQATFDEMWRSVSKYLPQLTELNFGYGRAHDGEPLIPNFRTLFNAELVTRTLTRIRTNVPLLDKVS